MPASLDFFRLKDIPLLARPNYAAELRHMVLWGLFANLVDGSFASIVVAKTFHSPLLVPVVWATPMLANLLNFIWAILLRGRPKVQAFVFLAVCAALSTGSVAFTPSDWHPWGGWLFAAQIAAARVFVSGLVTLRTSIWRSNYPASHRAQIAGRLQAVSALLMLAMGLLASLAFDQHASYYRFVYPAAGGIGLLSLIPLRRLRIRGQAQELARLQQHLGAHAGDGPARLLASLREAASILKRDRDFARYCSAQYLLGSANFMVDPVLTIFLTQSLKLGYFSSYLLMEQIPTVLALLTIPRWARLFDRVGVLRFRVINCVYWLAGMVLVAGALLIRLMQFQWVGLASIGMLVVGRLSNGAGRGGGMIAWNLGHLHFAGPHQAELYMGVHVALTGLRGLVMPAIGTAAYQTLGPGSLLLAVALTTASWLSFRRLAQADRSRPPQPPTSPDLGQSAARQVGMTACAGYGQPSEAGIGTNP